MLKQMQKIISLLLALTATNLYATQFPTSYQATYEISRGGKAIAEQTTTFKNTHNGYTLEDITQGTHGLASFTGFERKESSQFEIHDNQIESINHKMQQKVAFKKKTHHFKVTANSDSINGQAKKPFTIKSHEKPISSHMIALWLSAQACEGKKQITIPVLKSNHIKSYEFEVISDDSNFLKIARIYPVADKSSSEIWLDPTQQCIPIKTRHQEDDEPIIETKLLNQSLKLTTNNNQPINAKSNLKN